MNKISIIGSNILAMLLVACGDGDSSYENSSAMNAGTGYYVDSAVEGVSYECGIHTGVTDAEGKFVFDLNQGCRFSLAGITLRETNGSDMLDGGKIVENNESVARFLQSLDNDGNPNNGIQITSDVVDVLIGALQGAGSEGRIPIDSEVENVITSIKNEVASYQGRAKTADEVNTHLANTLLNFTKESLAGKKMYRVSNEESSTMSASIALYELSFNQEMTSYTKIAKTGSYTENITTEFSLNGNTITLLDDSTFTFNNEDKDCYNFYVASVKSGKDTFTRYGVECFYKSYDKAKIAYDELFNVSVGTVPNYALEN
ncbi:MAG: hypothetical protein RBR54_05425 [Sulfurimonas sp.]|nr:hypothetical protein [Sulfurimonas sp.]